MGRNALSAMVLVLIVATVIQVFSQGSNSARPSFEVASIKPNNSGSRDSNTATHDGGYLSATNVTLKLLIMQSYGLQDFQISGGPDWMNTATFDVQARAAEGTVPPRITQPDPTQPSTIQLMMQSLLEERFRVRSHSETRELPVYMLSIGKEGPKLKAAVEGLPGPQGLSPGSMQWNGSNGKVEVVGSAIPIKTLAAGLSQQLQRPVIDNTNLKGTFDVVLNCQVPTVVSGGGPELAPIAEADGPSIFTAVQEQLGLKLESSKGPVEVLLIDSVERPSEN
jgi:bla regulator protein blaR1